MTPDTDPPQEMGPAEGGELSDADMDKVGELKGEAAEAASNGDHAKAVAAFTKVIKLAPSPLVYAKRADSYLKMKKPNAAIRDCDKALALNPDSAKALRVRGSAYRYLGEYEKAIEHCTKALNVFDQMWDELTTLSAGKVTFLDTFHATTCCLQGALMHAAQPQAALEQAERARSRALEQLLMEQRVCAAQGPAACKVQLEDRQEFENEYSAKQTNKKSDQLDFGALRDFAVRQQTALIVYSQISSSELIVWVLSSMDGSLTHRSPRFVSTFFDIWCSSQKMY